MLRNFPRIYRAFILWVRKIPAKFRPNFPPDLPPQKHKIIHRRASAGAQGEGRVRRKILHENPQQILKILYTKDARHIAADGPGPNFGQKVNFGLIFLERL